MGYTTDLYGCIFVSPPLSRKAAKFINDLSHSRRMRRDVRAVGLDPRAYGIDGELYLPKQKYFQKGEVTVTDHNMHPRTQFSLNMDWIYDENISAIKWNGSEKFYGFVDWLQYLIEKVVIPDGAEANGTIVWQGEDSSDRGKITVEHNKLQTERLEGGGYTDDEEEDADGGSAEMEGQAEISAKDREAAELAKDEVLEKRRKANESFKALKEQCVAQENNATIGCTYVQSLVELCVAAVVAGSYRGSVSILPLELKQRILATLLLAPPQFSSFDLASLFDEQWDELDFSSYDPGESIVYMLSREEEKPSPHHITDGLVALIRERCTNLKRLSLRDCLALTSKSLESISNCVHLESLDITACTPQTVKNPILAPVTDKGLHRIAEGCPNLKQLHLSCNHALTDQGIINILSTGNLANNLRTLVCAGIPNLKDSAAGTIVNRCVNLKRLSLFGCQQVSDIAFTDNTIKCSRLRSLELSYTGVTVATLRVLAETIQGLRKLGLNRTVLDAGALVIGTQFPQLKHLYVDRVAEDFFESWTRRMRGEPAPTDTAVELIKSKRRELCSVPLELMEFDAQRHERMGGFPF